MARPKAYSYTRFSTPEQKKGHSLQRQIEASRRCAENYQLDLDESSTFDDPGKSAFRGTNIEEGALGRFLEVVDQGRVKPGSYLLVESLDRLSRQTVMRAFRLFCDILDRGINIITIQDDKVYPANLDELGFSDLLISLGVMQRAHEESLTKSKRLSAAWSAKRLRAQKENRKLTARCPKWLKLYHDTDSFKFIDDRADVVKRIFDMTLDGYGARSIVRTFNEEGVNTFGRSNGWYESSIRKILNNKAVIGVCQPHKYEIKNGKRKRVPDGEPIEGYYPEVVDVPTFMKARQLIMDRRIPSGKAGKSYSNLFTGIAYCGACDSPMHFDNKGRGPKGGTYLVCSNARRKVGDCERHAWKYPQVLNHIIVNLSEIDYREALPELYQKSQQTVDRLEDEIIVKKTEIDNTNRSRERIADAIEESGNSPTLISRLKSLDTKMIRLQSELEELRDRHRSERNRTDRADQQYGIMNQALRKFIDIEWEGDSDQIYNARRRLHQLLKSTIDRIIFSPTDSSIQKLAEPPVEKAHGKVEISFQGIESYFRWIFVDINQKISNGYKVRRDDKGTFELKSQGTIIDATWPPHDGGIWNTADLAPSFLGIPEKDMF